MQKILQRVGVDPFVAFAVVAIDAMLFVPDSGGVSWVISLIVGMLLVIPVMIMQRFSYRDSWRVAAAKGITVGILTAIPTPLPSILTGALGLAAMAASIRRDDSKWDAIVTRQMDKKE
jgi:hypothetical protein